MSATSMFWASTITINTSPVAVCRNKMTYTLYRPNGLPCYRASEAGVRGSAVLRSQFLRSLLLSQLL